MPSRRCTNMSQAQDTGKIGEITGLCPIRWGLFPIPRNAVPDARFRLLYYGIIPILCVLLPMHSFAYVVGLTCLLLCLWKGQRRLIQASGSYKDYRSTLRTEASSGPYIDFFDLAWFLLYNTLWTLTNQNRRES